MNGATDLLTMRQLLEAAPWLTERWVRSLVARRELPHYKVGGRLLFKLADVEAVVAQGYVPAASAPEK